MLDGFHDNKKGTAPTISALLLMAITVGCMVLVIGSGENIIRLQSAQMGERLCVENVFFTADHIKIYASNVGDGDITLEYAVINGKMYTLTDGLVTLLENGGQFVIIENYTVNSQGNYRISFISSHNKDLGLTEVQYP